MLTLREYLKEHDSTSANPEGNASAQDERFVAYAVVMCVSKEFASEDPAVWSAFCAADQAAGESR